MHNTRPCAGCFLSSADPAHPDEPGNPRTRVQPSPAHHSAKRQRVRRCRLGRAQERRHRAAARTRTGQGRVDAAGAEPARRLRLPGLRLARPRAHVHLRVLRERGQGRGRRDHRQARHARVLCAPHRHQPARAERLRTGEPGPPDRADGVRRRVRPLRADQLGRCLRADRKAPTRPALARHGGLLHLGARQQRGCLPLPADGAPLRHQQLPRLLEHVPRADLGRPAGGGRHRQGHRAARGLRPRRHAAAVRPEPGHQPPAHARRAARVRQARRHHRLHQPAARAWPRALRQPAACGRHAQAGWRADQLGVHPADSGRRLRAA